MCMQRKSVRAVNYKNMSAKTDQHQAERFDSSFQKNYSNNYNYKPTIVRKKLKNCYITEKLIKNKSSELQLNESHGPNNNVHLIFRIVSATLSKSPFFLFQKQYPVKENSFFLENKSKNSNV